MSAAARTLRKIKRPDYVILGLTLVLLLIGLQAVYSASFVLAITEYNDVTYFILRQGLWAILGLVLLVVFSGIDYHFWKGPSFLLMLITLGMMAALLFPGFGVHQYGATRWLKLGPLPPVQPSEFIKLVMIMYVSAWLSAKGDRLRGWSTGFVPFVLIVGLVGGLVMLQPDLGTTMIIVLTTTTIFFVAGASLTQFALLILGGAAAGALLIFSGGYRLGRWDAFVNPWDDPAGKGFHIIQSLIALGSGGISGLGPGASRQKFFYIPSSHTDGIFAVIGEEVGLIGAVLVIVLFATLIYRSFRVALNADDRLGALMVTGVACWLAYQALLNIGGITRSIPMTGVPLPFVSYGGSALATNMAAIGLVLNISRHVKRADSGPPSG